MASASGVGRPERRRGGWIGRAVVLALLIVPLLEISLIVLVGQQVGPWWTFASLLAMCVLGAWLVRREGGRTWHRLREAVRNGQPPARELSDAALVLVGGTMLLTPGFLTDAVGLFLVLPLTRPLTRSWLQGVVTSRLLGTAASSTSGFGPMRRRTKSGRDRGPRSEVIEGEVVREDPSGDQPGQHSPEH